MGLENQSFLVDNMQNRVANAWLPGLSPDGDGRAWEPQQPHARPPKKRGLDDARGVLVALQVLI